MILIAIVFNIQKYQEAKPTSGHPNSFDQKQIQQDDEQNYPSVTLTRMLP